MQKPYFIAAAAAKECGGVFNSPFENVNVTEYSGELRDKIYCAGEVVVTEIRHFRSYLALFLDLYRQKISAVTQRKTDELVSIARDLLSGAYNQVFFGRFRSGIFGIFQRFAAAGRAARILFFAF